MKGNPYSSNKYPTCKCNCCNKDIPLSAALTPEGKDYTYHFCGKDCFEKWKMMKEKGDTNL